MILNLPYSSLLPRFKPIPQAPWVPKQSPKSPCQLSCHNVTLLRWRAENLRVVFGSENHIRGQHWHTTSSYAEVAFVAELNLRHPIQILGGCGWGCVATTLDQELLLPPILLIWTTQSSLSISCASNKTTSRRKKIALPRALIGQSIRSLYLVRRSFVASALSCLLLPPVTSSNWNLKLPRSLQRLRKFFFLDPHSCLFQQLLQKKEREKEKNCFE